MSEADVVYSCGACGYHLNLTSSNRTTNIGPEYQKSIKKGFISFISVDLSRFTQVDQITCLPISWASRPKTKLLCRQCESVIGYGYGASAALCGFDSERSSSRQKYMIKIRSLQPSEP